MFPIFRGRASIWRLGVRFAPAEGGVPTRDRSGSQAVASGRASGPWTGARAADSRMTVP